MLCNLGSTYFLIELLFLTAAASRSFWFLVLDLLGLILSGRLLVFLESGSGFLKVMKNFFLRLELVDSAGVGKIEGEFLMSEMNELLPGVCSVITTLVLPHSNFYFFITKL